MWKCGGSSGVRRLPSFSIATTLLIAVVCIAIVAADKHSEAEENSGLCILRQGTRIWKSFRSRVFRFQKAGEEQKWPELKVSVRTISAAFLCALASAICSASGLGGGDLFVPLVNLLLQFDPKTSAVLSNFMIVGSTVVGVVLNLSRDHPTELNKSLIDFDISLLLQPNMLLGISIGVILNQMFPSWFIKSLLTLVLAYIAIHTSKSGLKRWEKESCQAAGKEKMRERLLERNNTETEEAHKNLFPGSDQSCSSRYPVKTILALVFVWLAIFAVQILRGGHGRQGLIKLEECGVRYWLLTAAQIPVAFGVTAWVAVRLHNSVAENGSDTSEAEGLVLRPRESTVFPAIALLAGLLGGMLGIGGAMIINPLLLSVGVLPQVTAATTLFMVFFSSSMSVAQFWLTGRIPINYALIGTCISTLSSAVGILGLQRVINKFGRPSLIVFAVATVIGLTAVLMAVFGGWDVWQQYQSGADMGFNYPC